MTKSHIPETQTAFPVLYILMRNDLASMNAGKGMAQASHASNAFLKHLNDTVFDLLEDDDVIGHEIERLANIWQLETNQGFGTVLVLGVDETQMRTAVNIAQKLDYVAGVVHDPTYPLVDGDVCHFLRLDTCAYIFGDKNDPVLSAIVARFSLHP